MMPSPVCVCLNFFTPKYVGDSFICQDSCSLMNCESLNAKCRQVGANSTECFCSATGNETTTKCPDGPKPDILPSHDAGENMGLILGISVGLGGLVILAIIAAIWWYRERKKKQLLEDERINRAMEEAAFHISNVANLKTSNNIPGVNSAPTTTKTSQQYTSVPSIVSSEPNRSGLKVSTTQLLEEDDAVYDDISTRKP
eukprot:Sdes_comp20904_c0_seq2m18102